MLFKPQTIELIEEYVNSILVNDGDVNDTIELVYMLRDEKTLLSQFVKRYLFFGSRQDFSDWFSIVSESDLFVRDFVDRLNGALINIPIYKEEIFAQINWDTITRNRMQNQPKGDDLAYLNKRLIWKISEKRINCNCYASGGNGLFKESCKL